MTLTRLRKHWNVLLIRKNVLLSKYTFWCILLPIIVTLLLIHVLLNHSMFTYVYYVALLMHRNV